MKGEVKAIDVNGTTCCVCLETLKVPRELTCGHHVCLHCTRSITSSTQHNNNNNTNDNANLGPTLRCPLCHTLTKEHDLPEQVKDQVNSSVLCGYCEKAPATRECLNCSKPEILPLCLDCSILIHKGKMSSHTVTDMDSSPKKQIVERCTVHGKKKMYFCEDDTSLICGHCMGDNHKGHKAVPVSNAAKSLLPQLQERVTNLPAVQHALKSFITNLDEHINEMLKEKTKHEHHLAFAMSEILRVLEETRGALQQAINTLYNLPELLALRSKTTVQIAVINTFKSKGTQVENLEELDIVRLFCSIPELNKIARTPAFTMQAASKLDTDGIVHAITRLQALPCFNIAQLPELIVTKRVELDPKKDHSYSLVRIEKGGILTSSSATPLVLNIQVLAIAAEGYIDLNGNGHAGGAAVPCVTDGYANQGESSDGGGGQSRSANGGGGGGGQGCWNFGSTGGGGGGYGRVGSVGGTNTHNGGNYPGGSGGNTHGAPELATLDLGSGGGSGHPYSSGTGGKGGNGGGALRINAWKIINNGTISCNGENGKEGTQHGSGGGGGSGGSIYLQANEFENKGKITATGGQGGFNRFPSHPTICSKGGNGGDGRIRVDLPKSTAIGNIVPQPYLG